MLALADAAVADGGVVCKRRRLKRTAWGGGLLTNGSPEWPNCLAPLASRGFPLAGSMQWTFAG